MANRRQVGQSMRLGLATLLEDLSGEVPEELRAPVLRVLHTVKNDQQPPSREDMALLLHHLLLSRDLERRASVAAREAKPKPPRKPPREPRRQIGRPSSDPSGRRTTSPQPADEPVGSVFHDRILEVEETDDERALRRRFGINNKR